jgi:hypothetical protein
MKKAIWLFLTVSISILFTASVGSAAAPKKTTRRAAPPINTPSADTSTRLALVIGNSAYSTGPLKNPVNDATDMAAALKDLGFTVILKKNADLRTMEESLEEFGNCLKKGGVGLFFYAGHGVQVQTVNYLIPVDAKVNKESDVKYAALDAGKVLDEMANANNGLNIVVLDACRDNPFARKFRTGTRGLAGINDAPSGTIISYSTGPGKVARDGEGRNSPFTAALLETIKEPGLKIEDVFKNVRQKISSATDGQQIPWELSSLQKDFYFNPSSRPEKSKEEKQTAALGVQNQPEDPELEKEKKKIAEERRRLEAEKIQLEQDRKRIEKEQKLEEERQRLAEEKRRIEEERQALAEQKKKKPTVTAMAPRPSARPASPSTYTDSTTGIEMVLVKGGCYQMGDNFGDGDGDERPVHKACVGDFYLGKYEVTQGQWKAIMGNNPSHFSDCGDNCPVEKVSWNDVFSGASFKLAPTQSSGRFQTCLQTMGPGYKPAPTQKAIYEGRLTAFDKPYR